MLIGDLHWAIPLFHETTIKDGAGFGFWGFLITVIHMINASKILSELELFMIFLFNLSCHKMEDTLKHSEKTVAFLNIDVLIPKSPNFLQTSFLGK